MDCLTKEQLLLLQNHLPYARYEEFIKMFKEEELLPEDQIEYTKLLNLVTPQESRENIECWDYDGHVLCSPHPRLQYEHTDFIDEYIRDTEQYDILSSTSWQTFNNLKFGIYKIELSDGRPAQYINIPIKAGTAFNSNATFSGIWCYDYNWEEKTCGGVLNEANWGDSGDFRLYLR